MSEGISDQEFAAFCDLKSKEGGIPAGCVNYVTGEIIWIDGNGKSMSTEQYIKTHGFDPAPVWGKILEYNATKKLKQQYNVPVFPRQMALEKPKKLYRQLSTLPQFRKGE